MDRVLFTQTKGGIVQALHSIHRICIIAICQNTMA